MAALILFLLLAQTPEDLYRQGLLLLRENKVQQAATLFEEAAKQDPAAPLVWMALADARLRLNQFADAEAAERRAVKLAGADPVVRQARAMFHARFARFAELPEVSAVHWKQAVTLAPDREQYRLSYIQFLLDRRADRESEAEARAAIERFPQNPELHRLLGVALYAQGRNDEALGSFCQAIDLAPNDEQYYASLETLLPVTGPRAAAVTERLQRFVKTNPTSPLGLYLLALTSPGEGQALLDRAVALDPSFWPAYFELHKYKTNPTEQIPLLEKTIALNAEYAPAWYALAQAYAKTRNVEAARKAREQHHRLVTQQR